LRLRSATALGSARRFSPLCAVPRTAGSFRLDASAGANNPHMTERGIARDFGVSRQVVNQHLYGAARGGHRVGGAIAKRRKAARRRGLGW
jgi:hypothetical protein